MTAVAGSTVSLNPVVRSAEVGFREETVASAALGSEWIPCSDLAHPSGSPVYGWCLTRSQVAGSVWSRISS